MKKTTVAIALALFAFNSQANEVNLSSSVSWQVTAVKEANQTASSQQFNAPENNRITVDFNQQKQQFNIGKTTLLNEARQKNNNNTVVYKINVKPAKNKKNKDYTLDLVLNKTEALSEKDLLQPIQIQMKNPSKNGQAISMAELPDGQYHAEMELVAEHYWL